MQLPDPIIKPINLKYPLAFSPNGAFAMNYDTVSAVADDLKILIKTNWGERPIQYDFGANLRAILFEPTTNIKQQMIDAITTSVNKWMPFVNIDNIVVALNSDDTTIDYNSAVMKIYFSIGQTGLSGDVSVTV